MRPTVMSSVMVKAPPGSVFAAMRFPLSVFLCEPTIGHVGAHEKRPLHPGTGRPWIGALPSCILGGMDRNGLADFLRRRRDGLQPSDVGLHAGARRRTRGLRREEVAGLAHMSTDFYARLEQQRDSRPSEQTTAALPRGLALPPAEGT